MDHTSIQKRLRDLQDSELPQEERRQIRQHLESCPACRQQLERWQSTRQALSQLLQVAPSETFVSRVMEEVERVPARQPAHWRIELGRWIPRIPAWLYPELGIAVAALLLLAIGSFQQGTVSMETLLLNREPRDVQWVAAHQRSNRTDLDMLWEGA